MAGLTIARLAGFIGHAAQTMRTLEDELNAADAKLGDGDTGQTLRRVLEKIAPVAAAAPPDLTVAFRDIAKASGAATGSSLGTLITVAAMTMAKAAGGRSEIAWTELGGLIGQIRDAMAARGGATLGDKTVLDGVDAVATAIAGLDDPQRTKAAAADAAAAALERFRDQPCRIGRARMFAEKSVGLDDPGMLALARLLAA